MAIYLYSSSCEGCAGNHALNKIKQLCKQEKIDFQERRTIFWDRWEKEANEIMKINDIKLPLFYETESGLTLEANSLTPLDTLERWINKTRKPNE